MDLFCPEKTHRPSRAGAPLLRLLSPEAPPPHPALQSQTRLPVLSCRAHEPPQLCVAVRLSRTLMESPPCFWAGLSAHCKLLFGGPDIGFFQLDHPHTQEMELVSTASWSEPEQRSY